MLNLFCYIKLYLFFHVTYMLIKMHALKDKPTYALTATIKDWEKGHGVKKKSNL